MQRAIFKVFLRVSVYVTVCVESFCMGWRLPVTVPLVLDAVWKQNDETYSDSEIFSNWSLEV
jgi:hypothetical protein